MITDYERRLAECVARGRTNEQIAVLLERAPGTIKNDLYKLYEKLGFRYAGSPRALLARWHVEQEREDRLQAAGETNLKVLQFVREYWLKFHCSPTFREIMYALDLSSTSVVNHHIKRLKELDLVRDDIEGHRSIVPSDMVISFDRAEIEQLKEELAEAKEFLADFGILENAA